jgi:hypothetical protein
MQRHPMHDDAKNVQAAIEAAVENGNAIHVRTNHGYVYTARILQTGDRYGYAGTWKHDKPGITIDGTPATYFLDTIQDHRPEFPLAIDAGQDWCLTPASTIDFVNLARGLHPTQIEMDRMEREAREIGMDL